MKLFKNFKMYINKKLQLVTKPFRTKFLESEFKQESEDWGKIKSLNAMEALAFWEEGCEEFLELNPVDPPYQGKKQSFQNQNFTGSHNRQGSNFHIKEPKTNPKPKNHALKTHADIKAARLELEKKLKEAHFVNESLVKKLFLKKDREAALAAEKQKNQKIQYLKNEFLKLRIAELKLEAFEEKNSKKAHQEDLSVSQEEMSFMLNEKALFNHENEVFELIQNCSLTKKSESKNELSFNPAAIQKELKPIKESLEKVILPAKKNQLKLKADLEKFQRIPQDILDKIILNEERLVRMEKMQNHMETIDEKLKNEEIKMKESYSQALEQKWKTQMPETNKQCSTHAKSYFKKNESTKVSQESLKISC